MLENLINFIKQKNTIKIIMLENFINYLRYKKGCRRVKTLEKIWN